MAGKEFPISLIVKAVNQATAPLRQVSAQLGDISKKVSGAGKALTTGVTLPLAGMAAGAVVAFGHFEAGMASVSTLVDTSVESIDAMGKSVLDISKRVPVGIGDLTEALASARGAGVNAADQFIVLEHSAKLGAAALGSTKDAVDVATSAMNAFGLKGKDAEGIYNTFFQAVNYGKMSLADFAQGFGDTAGTVAGAGIKLDEYSAAVAALTTTGLKASSAHTQLKAVISGLTGQTKEAAAIFKRLGVKSFKELVAQSGGLVPALEKVRGVVKTNDTVFLKALGGAEAFNAALGLTGNQAETFRQALEAMRNGVDGVGVAFEKQNATGKATMQRLRNEFEGIAISVGRILMPVLQQLAPVLENLVARWEGLGDSGQTSVVAVVAAVAALGPTITVMGNLATAVSATGKAISFISGWGKYLWMMRASIMSGLVPSLTAAATSVWGFTAALLANPITWVVAGVAALAGAVYLIYKNWEPIKAFFVETWAAIKGAAAAGLAWMLKNMSWTPLALIINNWEPIKAYFVGLWDSIVGVFKSAWNKVQPVVDALKTARDFYFGGPSAASATPIGAERPLLGAAQMAPGAGVLAPQQSETRVVVDFSNLPRGARVTEAPGGTAPLDLSLGYGMMGG